MNVHAGKPRVPITPATKVGDLLESWPELEEVLIAQAPAFRRLRNPVLRRTVARVATLQQAAGVGGLGVRDLVASLRRAAGLEEAASPDSGTAASTEPANPPEWVDRFPVVASIDADALLEAGQVPLPLVNDRARALGTGETLRVASGFPPVPLVETLTRQGFRCFTREETLGVFETLVSRA